MSKTIEIDESIGQRQLNSFAKREKNQIWMVRFADEFSSTSQTEIPTIAKRSIDAIISAIEHRFSSRQEIKIISHAEYPNESGQTEAHVSYRVRSNRMEAFAVLQTLI